MSDTCIACGERPKTPNDSDFCKACADDAALGLAMNNLAAAARLCREAAKTHPRGPKLLCAANSLDDAERWLDGAFAAVDPDEVFDRR